MFERRTLEPTSRMFEQYGRNADHIRVWYSKVVLHGLPQQSQVEGAIACLGDGSAEMLRLFSGWERQQEAIDRMVARARLQV